MKRRLLEANEIQAILIDKNITVDKTIVEAIAVALEENNKRLLHAIELERV